MRSDLSEEENEGDTRTTSEGARNSSSRRMRSWLDWKEDGKRAYERCDYEHALESYRKALQPEYECPTKADRAVLWSNVVACRLQLVKNESGGDPQARAAVEDAKQCVALNPNWAKGFMRLASAYIALGGHSNDACNALQSAIRLDPGNKDARQMLVRELRRDHANAASASAVGNSPPQPQPSASGYDTIRETTPPPSNPDYVPASSFSFASSSTSSSSTGSVPSSAPPTTAHHRRPTVDDGLTWRERISFQASRASEWYQNLNGDVKTILKIGLLLLALYVAFGGRFGFEESLRSTTSASHRYNIYNDPANDDGAKTTSRGNYGAENAYEQYRRQKQQVQQQKRRNTHGGGYHHGARAYDDDTYYDPYSYAPPPPPPTRRSSSFRLSDLFDGSLPSLLLLGGILYLCHYSGINPFQALLVMNIMAGGRRGGGGVYYGGGGRRRGFRW
ncbi:hypothetical protein ACA910_000634 [Epithemia clementina (nom. ined.)]